MTRLKQFLLSLVNATLVLGIILVVLALVLLNQAESFTANVISDVKLGLLEEIDTDIKDVVGSIRSTEEELRVVANRLKQIVDQPEITLSPEIRAEITSIDAELGALKQEVTKFLSSHESLSDEAVQRIAATIAEAYIGIRGCRRTPQSAGSG